MYLKSFVQHSERIEAQEGLARIFQQFNRFFTCDGLMCPFGGKTKGAEEFRQEFSKNLLRRIYTVGNVLFVAFLVM